VDQHILTVSKPNTPTNIKYSNLAVCMTAFRLNMVSKEFWLSSQNFARGRDIFITETRHYATTLQKKFIKMISNYT
jgi:hypothetical protein